MVEIEIEIGQRLMEFLTAWLIPILYTEFRLHRHSNHQSDDLKSIRSELEELKKKFETPTR